MTTALYPAALSWFGDFCDGVRSASAGKNVTLVLALDGIDPDTYPDIYMDLRNLENSNLNVFAFNATGSPADIRVAMLKIALDRSSDIIVFADADDSLYSRAFDLHTEALQSADISFSDMDIIDQNGQCDGRTFFQGARIPRRLCNMSPLVHRNFLGLTNTAIRRQVLANLDITSTPHVTAFDWWMFTSLLIQGAKAQKTTKSVTRYRHHPHATLGAFPDTARKSVAKRCSIVAEHATCFPNHPALTQFGQAARHMENALNNDEHHHTAILQACAGPGVWFEDISRLVDEVVSP